MLIPPGGKDKRFHSLEHLHPDSIPTLTEQVVAFVDRYMPPGGKRRED